MSLCCCNTRTNCTGIAVVTSLIVGIITAFLTFTAAITVTPAFLWVLLGIAVVYLPITLVVSALGHESRRNSCFCSILPVTLVGILGTILTSIVLLGITFAATSVLGAIISGLLLAFFTLTITTVACLAYCLANCTDACDF